MAGRVTLARMTQAPSVLLASTEVAMADPVDAVPLLDRAGRGAVADRPQPGTVRRAEPGPDGPLRFVAAQRDGTVVVQVWGSQATPRADRDAALEQALAWIGADDGDADLTAATAAHPALHRAARRLGPVRLSRMPRVQEALGRAALGALVQREEASRSATQLAAMVGVPADDALWCWPEPSALARTPAHELRRCGISRRVAGVLHGGALDAGALERVRDDPERLDLRLRAIRGLGVWTSGETRRVLGDPDAVPLGDDGLPRLVCHALTGAVDDACSDGEMLRLLEPYAGQRGRVARLVLLGVSRGLLPRHPRRGPRAALSAHRYW